MALSTYSELKASLADWLNRSDLTAIIPDFITMAEAQVQRELKHWQMYKRDTLSVSSQYTALPSDFIEPIRLDVSGQYKPLQPTSINEMQSARYRTSDTAGVPEYYALTGGSLEVYPTPDSTYTVNIVYRYTLAGLSDSNTSNWLLAEAPDVYLYGALMQSAPYLVNDERLPIWAGMYSSGIQALQLSSDNARFGANLRLRISNG